MKIEAGTQAWGIFQGDANGLPQVTAFKKLQAPENAAAIEDLLHAKVFDPLELAAQPLGRWMGLIGFRHVNGIFAFAVLISRPEKELVHRRFRGLVIDQRVIRQTRFGLGQIK